MKQTGGAKVRQNTNYYMGADTAFAGVWEVPKSGAWNERELWKARNRKKYEQCLEDQYDSDGEEKCEAEV